MININEIIQAIQTEMKDFLDECGLSLRIHSEYSTNAYVLTFTTVTGEQLIQMIRCEELDLIEDSSYYLDYVKHQVKNKLKDMLLKKQKTIKKHTKSDWGNYSIGYPDIASSNAYAGYLNYSYDISSTTYPEAATLTMDKIKEAADSLTGQNLSSIDKLRNKIDNGLKPILDKLTLV
jgi:hypothetical protein